MSVINIQALISKRGGGHGEKEGTLPKRGTIKKRIYLFTMIFSSDQA